MGSRVLSGSQILSSTFFALSRNAFKKLQFTRSGSTKHWDPRFKKLRARKVVKIELPDYDEFRKNAEVTPEEIRSMMKEKGIAPPRATSLRTMVISSTGGIFEPYVPPEGDGKISSLSYVGTKQRLEWLQKKGKSSMALRKIRQYEEEFEVDEFLTKAQEIYVEAHKALAEKDEDKLIGLVTEKCFPEMIFNIKRKTLRWNFLEPLEPARVAHIRCTDVITKTNIFAQITVRHHSKQTLAVYDRFGRIMYGSETTPKDVLEYVVYEKHLSNEYGEWRIHGKIIPDWMTKKETLKRTFRRVEMEPPPPPDSQTESKNVTSSSPDSQTESKSDVTSSKTS